METSYTNLEENQKLSIVSFIVGQEHKSTSKRENRNYLTLALLSIVTALFHSLAIAFLIELHIDQLIISLVIFLFCFVLIVLFNRIYFVFKKSNAKGSMLMVAIYLLFYLVLSFMVSPQIFKYYYLQEEIMQTKAGESALKLFSALIRVEQKLTINEKKSLNDFTLLIEGLSLLFSMLGAIVHHFINLNSKNEAEMQSEQLLKNLEIELLQKKEQYANLFSGDGIKIKPNNDNPFAEEDTTTESIEEQRDKLLHEIFHIQNAINLL
jgi:hypothetical protein